MVRTRCITSDGGIDLPIQDRTHPRGRSVRSRCGSLNADPERRGSAALQDLADIHAR